MAENAKKDQLKSSISIDPNDEFPISAEVYCRLKHSNKLISKIFLKAMIVEARFKKNYIKDWDKKFSEFFSRKV